MEHLNLPPFYVGQRVVGIASGRYVDVRGKRFTVLGLKECAGCKRWTVDVGLKDDSTFSRCDCGCLKESRGILWNRPRLFAPIQENFQSISLEKVLEQETKLISVN